jgi:hypothetical protein
MLTLALRMKRMARRYQIKLEVDTKATVMAGKG